MLLILIFKDDSGKKIEDFVFSKKEETNSGVFYHFVPKTLDPYKIEMISVELKSEPGS